MIEAKLELDPIMSRRNPLYKQQAEFQPTGWGGVVVLTPSLGYSPTEAANHGLRAMDPTVCLSAG